MSDAPVAEAAPAPVPEKPRRRFFPRFSLCTLTLCVLLAASGLGVWWKWEPWVVVLRLGGHRTLIGHAEYAKDGSKILTYARGLPPFTGPAKPPERSETENEMFVWDAATGHRQADIRWGWNSSAYLGGWDYAGFSEDGKWVEAGLDGPKVAGPIRALFDAQSGQALLPKRVQTHCAKLAFSPDEKKLLVWYPNEAPELWDLERWEKQCGLEGIGTAVKEWRFSEDGKRVAISGTIDAQDAIGIFDTESGRRLLWIPFPSPDWLAFTPDDTALLGRFSMRNLKGNEQAFQAMVDELIEKYGKNYHQVNQTFAALVDLKTGHLRRWIAGDCRFFTFTPDCRLIEQTVAPAGAEVQIRDGNTLERICSVKGSLGSWEKNAVSKDGARLLTTTPYELSSEQVGYIPKSPTDPVEVWEWDTRTGAEIANVTLPEKGNNTVRSMGYLDDDARAFASTLNGIYSWDAGTGANLVAFQGSASPSPDERRVLLWSAGENLRFGDLRSQEILEELEGTANTSMPIISFSPDGVRMLLVPGGSADEAQVWERRREEGFAGVLTLPEFWLTVVFALLLVWSLIRDFKTLRKASTAPKNFTAHRRPAPTGRRWAVNEEGRRRRSSPDSCILKPES